MPLLFRSWNEQCVVYSVFSADLYLLTTFNAELLQLVKKNISKQDLVIRISNFYQVNNEEAQDLLDDLIDEYQSLGLLD